jgi:hypothetical protein
VTTPASRRVRAGVTALTVLAPLAAAFGLLLAFGTLLSTLNVTVGPAQISGYSWALGVGLLPALGLVVVAITGRGFSSTRRYVAGFFGVLCAAAGLYFTAPLLVDAVVTTTENDRLRELPVGAEEEKYSVSDLRRLSDEFLADSTSTLDRAHPVRPTGALAEPCALGNLDDGTLLRTLGDQQFWTFDTETAALDAVAKRWELAGLDVSRAGGGLAAHGDDADWLGAAEVRWDDSAVDYNLVISFETICVLD